MPAAAADAPLSAAEADALLAPLAGASRIVLAVSGGADSLALLLLAADWRRRSGGDVGMLVATVDHGLRTGSADEAAMVAGVAERLGLPHCVLHWTGPKPGAGIEAAAREARYRLLADCARAAGASHVVTAHHRDDQAETVLMRLGRGSGPAGLAGMAAARSLRPGVTLLRPLLATGRGRLVATVAASGLVPVADPHNADPRFARARLRKVLPHLAEAGIDPASVTRSAALLRRANEALDFHAARLAALVATADPLGVVRIDRAGFRDAPAETRLRVLSRFVAAIGGGDWPARIEKLEAVDAVIAVGDAFRRTLGGVVVRGDRRGVALYREAGRNGLPVLDLMAAGRDAIWDGRFTVRAETVPAGLTVGPLGEDGRRDAGIVAPGLAAAVAALPAFRLDGRTIAVPPLGLLRDEARELGLAADCVLAERLGIAVRPLPPDAIAIR